MTETPKAGLTVVGLYVENVKRIKAVNLTFPKRGLIKIAGQNGQGKSSALDAFVMLIGGKDAQPDLPVRDGAQHAKVVGDFGDFRATRRWTAKDSYLEVRRRGEKGVVPKPQDFLNALIGTGLGFDPADFIDGHKPAEQVATLLKLLRLPEDPRALDVQRRKLYDERTLVNREVRTLEAALAALPEPVEDVPDAEVSVADLAQEHARLVAIHHANDETRAAVARAQEVQRRAAAEVARFRKELAAAESALATATAAVEAAEAAALDAIDPDLTAITQRMQDAEAINATVRAQQARAAKAAELRSKQKEAADLTDALARLDDRKRELLAGAVFPVAGLGFGEVDGEYRVLFRGIPLEQCADSEKIRVGMAIAMALNPTIRVIILRRGSLLDDATLAAIGEIADGADYQVLCEIVGHGDERSFVIEDGGCIQVPAAAPAPTNVFAEEA